MKKALVLFIAACMLCVSMSSVVASYDTTVIATKKNNFELDSTQVVQPQQPDTTTMQILRQTVDGYLKMDETIYETPLQTQNQQTHTQPLLGGGKLFGLWIMVKYNGQEFSKEVNLNYWTIRGKLSDPNYRTPIRFNVDSDPEDDLEVGFGFYRSGISEMTDGGKVDHSGWATAFDFRQINNGLDDQLGEIEIWQEFHVDLSVITNYGYGQSFSKFKLLSNLYQILRGNIVKEHSSSTIFQKLAPAGMMPLNNDLLNIMKTAGYDDLEQQNPVMPTAKGDYIITRIGYRSCYGEKIPINFEKKFTVAKENIFRPAIFQHEMNPKDIIGTASNDVLFAFQAWQKGMNEPTYDIEFCVEFDPACYVLTQFTPLSGKTFYYYNSQSNEPTDITFKSSLLKGGSTAEEENATFQFTISLDSVPKEIVGAGKWMSFDLNLIGENSPLSGDFVYKASNKFNVGFKISSPWFEQKLAVRGVPSHAKFEWGLDAAIDIIPGQLFDFETIGFIDLTMNDKLDEIVLYYPKLDPDTKDVACFRIKDIPSSRTLTAGASLDINNATMLKIDANAYVQHDSSGSLGDITLYYPKADPENDPDMALFQIPSGSFAAYGKAEVIGQVYVDPDPDNFFVNPNNYFYAKAQRTSSSDFGEANLYLPNIDIPLLKVYSIPGNANGWGKFWWNQLKGHVRAERSSSSGEGPIRLSLKFDDLLVSNELMIGNGYIDMQGKIAEQGYFQFDTQNDMLGNSFEISNLATENSMAINAATISAKEFQSSWDLDTSSEEIQLQELALSGKLDAFRDFNVNINYQGENIHFNGDWSMGESGAFEIDFYQEDPIYLSFNMDDSFENVDLNGHVILSNHMHFDISWKWKAGSSADPGYFKINDNSNQPNIDEINLYFTYKDLWGANVTVYGLGIYICVEWWWDGTKFCWDVVKHITGTSNLDLLLNGVWYYNVQNN
jgi:hypothetical protein